MLATKIARRVWNAIPNHNAEMYRRGYYGAMLPTPPLHKRTRGTALAVSDYGRERLALWLAPWLRDSDVLLYPEAEGRDRYGRSLT